MASKQTRSLPKTGGSVFDPEQFGSSIPDKLDVRIIKARIAPWHYDGVDQYKTFARLVYQPLNDDREDDGNPFTTHLQMGWITNIVPTNDGPDVEDRTPAGGDDAVYLQLDAGEVQLEKDEIEQYEGIYALGTPSKKYGQEWTAWVDALLECGWKPRGESMADLEGMILTIEKTVIRKYQDRETHEEKNVSIHVPIALLDDGKGAGKSSGSASAKKTDASGKDAGKPKTSDKDKPSAGKSANKNANDDGPSAVLARAIRNVILRDGEEGPIPDTKKYPHASILMKAVKEEEFKALSATDRSAANKAFNAGELFVPKYGLMFDEDDAVVIANEE